MRPLLTIVLLLFTSALIHAQCERNAFLEIGGSGGLVSINYERAVRETHRMSPEYGQTQEELDKLAPPSRITLRIGLSTTPIDKNNGWVIIAPVMLNYMYGTKHQIEVGAGLAPSFTTHGAWFIKSPVQLSYRFVPDGKQYFIRISYTPIVAWLVDFQVQQWFGVSIGYRFVN